MSETVTITTQPVKGMCGVKYLARISVLGYLYHPLHKTEIYGPTQQDAENGAEEYAREYFDKLRQRQNQCRSKTIVI